MSTLRREIPLTAIRESTHTEFERAQEWLGAALAALEEGADDEARVRLLAILDGVDTLHRLGLARLIGLVKELGGRGLVDQLMRDPVVHALLEMYDLPELDDRGQVKRALQAVQSYIESRGGKLELLGVESGRVRVRLSGSCDGCSVSSSSATRAVEDALGEGYAGFIELIVESPMPVQPKVQPGRLPLRRPRWVSVGQMDEIAPGEMRAVWPEGRSILLVRLGSEVYAYRNGCPPDSPLALQAGRLEGATLVCPWHGCRYDVRTGKREDAAGKLQVLPVAVHSGEIKVAVGTEEVRLG